MAKFEVKKLVIAGMLAAVGVTSSTALAQPDMRFCQLYDLRMVTNARVGDTVGLTAATTSWNVGNQQLLWEASPDWDHPFIVLNMYKLKDGRFTQIGQSWVKHGFFALSNTQCGGSCSSTNGSRLGIGCTDTYTSSLNASQSGLGPRYEINPWNGQWNYQGSQFQNDTTSDNVITRRLQVKDADLDPALNAGAQYFIEGYYAIKDDKDTMNNGAWRPATIVSGSSGTSYTFTPNQFSSGVIPNVGFAIDAWVGARQTLIAQQLPIVENIPSNPPETWSPDGRAVIASMVTDLGDGTWRYEYAIYNIDMDRQIQSFTIPVPTGVELSDIGTYAVFHHNEPYAWSEVTGYNPSTGTGGTRTHGKSINNANWTVDTSRAGEITWSTPPVTVGDPSNPIRWGTMRNFWFKANVGPEDGSVTVGLFKQGPVMEITGVTNVPQAAPAPAHCPGDANSDGLVDFDDINAIIANWGAAYAAGSQGAGDANDDGSVDFDDINATIANWGVGCP